MTNPFKNSEDNKRYYTQNYYLRMKFGNKVFKVSLNGNFTCPNIDGTKGFGGCTYCSSKGSGDFAGNPADDIITQFNTIKDKMHTKWKEGVYIPYFQANTNTYGSVDYLKTVYEPVLALDNVVGLSIATRADAIADDVLDYLSDISKRTFLTVELGLQTIHDKTGDRINRCHSYEDFIQGYKRLRQRNINVCAHIINGLPGETHEMMLETARDISKLDLQSIKIHLLHVIEGTKIAEEYCNGEFDLMTLEDYVQIVCDQIEVLPPDLVIQRLTGDGDKATLIGPLWSLKKFVVINEIDKELVRRNSYQGINFSK